MKLFFQFLYIFCQMTMWVFFDKTSSVYFFNNKKGTISALAEKVKTLSFSVIKKEVATDTRHQNESIRIFFLKGGQAARGTEVRVTLLHVKPNPTIFYVVYYSLSMFCMTIIIFCARKFVFVVYEIFLLHFFVYIVHDIKSDLDFYINLIIHFILFSFKKNIS